MGTEELSFAAEGLNVWTDTTRFTVTREKLTAYAQATNDPIERHLAGDIANPVFAVVPVFQSLMEPALEVVPLPLLGKVVHGEQDFRFHRPIRPGDVLAARGAMLGYSGSPKGTRANVYLECRDDANGELVNEQFVTFFVRGFDAGERVGELAPAHAFEESVREQPPVTMLTQHIDTDQTYRYSEAADDPMPIHLEEDVARDAGLPGIIAHGLCTMAFTAWAALVELADCDVERLTRLAVRFAKPVLPDQDITTRFWRAANDQGITSYVYETTVDGTVVIKDGLAEIRD